MVSSHGAMKFDHPGYRKMADQVTTVVVFPNDATAILCYRVERLWQRAAKPSPTLQEQRNGQQEHDLSLV